MAKFDLRLSTGLSVEVEEKWAPSELNLVRSMADGHWPTDEYGWKINPAHVVLVRKVDENVDRT